MFLRFDLVAFYEFCNLSHLQMKRPVDNTISAKCKAVISSYLISYASCIIREEQVSISFLIYLATTFTYSQKSWIYKCGIISFLEDSCHKLRVDLYQRKWKGFKTNFCKLPYLARFSSLSSFYFCSWTVRNVI